MQKAEKLKTYEKGKFKPGYVSVKHNGIHGTSDVREGIIYSRTPNVIQGLGHINKSLSILPFNVLGEIVVPNIHFQEASGLIRSFDDTPKALFYVFDCILKDKTFKERNEVLQMIKTAFVSPLRIVDFIFCNTEKEYDIVHEVILKSGHEGTCLITPDHMNQPGKRTWNWMKRVPYKEMEVRITGILLGTKGKKYEKSLGAFECLTKEGKKVRVGIFKGQTDGWRQDVIDNPRKWYNTHITIIYKNTK